MTLIAPDPQVRQAVTEASSQAMRNFSGNLRALAETQAPVIAAVRRPEGEAEWVFGRDGFLTCRSASGAWGGGCSLPYRTATELFKTVEAKGTTVGLLAPGHAAQVRRMLDILAPSQGLLVFHDDPEFLAVALHCADFSGEIAGHRLFFFTGESWAAELRRVLEENTGLPTPATFIRPPTTTEAATKELIEATQPIFNDINAQRAGQLQALMSQAHTPRRAVRRVCVVAGSSYRLWNDAGAVLLEATKASAALEAVRFDPDRPTSASQLALADAASRCEGLVTADLTRAGAPQTAPKEMPWVTWVTTPGAIPARKAVGKRDRLLLADPAFVLPARSAGWSPNEFGVATWPKVTLAAAPAGAGVALIADTAAVRTDIEQDFFEFSSHMVLWEHIGNELRADPFALGHDAEAYLDQRMRRLSITAEGFDRGLFLNGLITPTYTQSLARLMIQRRPESVVIGRGWSEIPEFAGRVAGAASSRQELHALASRAGGFVLPLLTPRAHPIDAFDRPVIRTAGLSGEQFLHRLAKPAKVERPNIPPLSGELIHRLLNQS